MKLGAIAALALVVTAGVPVQAVEPGFWQHWGDGQAELDGYELLQMRYGQRREGTAVAVFVSEPFSEELRVKADPGKHAKGDEYQVIKLNLVEDFQTGIYDYNLMTSVFSRIEPGHGMTPGPVKIAFGSQEWCGNVFETLWFSPGGAVRFDRHSYFDGEADAQGVFDARDALFGDALFLVVRGLAPGAPAAGESVGIRFVPRLKALRLMHQNMTATPAMLRRAATAESVQVPAGVFEVERFTLEGKDGTRMTFLVEKAAPRRIVAWEIEGQESARLKGSVRAPYWKLNRNGDEEWLRKIGIR